MDQEVLATIIFAVSFIVFLTHWIGKQSVRKYIREFKDIDSAMAHKKKELEALNTEYSQLKETYEKTDQETKELQSLKGKADALQQQSDQCARQITDYSSEIETLEYRRKEARLETGLVTKKLDLYSRLNDLADHGHYEMPSFMFETSERYTEELKQVRAEQKEMIRDKLAVTYPETTIMFSDARQNKKILDGQVRLMLAAFNIKCDLTYG